MPTHTIFLPVCLAVIILRGQASAAYGDACDSDSDCTTADNTLCKISTGCTRGSCITCKTDYKYHSTSSTCKKDYGKSCDVDGDCYHGKCTTSLCACPMGTTWDSTYLGCYTDTNGWGDACDTTSPDPDSDCHVTSTDGGACTGTSGSTVCDCADTYSKSTGYLCLAPIIGEACLTACRIRGISDTAAEVAPTCQSSTCACNTAGMHYEATYEGQKYCTSVATPSPLKKASLECTGHNECESGRCKDCPESAGAVCVEETNSSARQTIKRTLAIVSTLVAVLVHL